MAFSLGAVFGVLSMLFTSTSDLFAAKASRAIKPLVAVFWSMCFGLIVMAVVFMIVRPALAFTPSTAALLLASGVLQIVALGSFFAAIEHEKVGVATAIASVYPVFTVAAAVLFLHETLSTVQAASIVAIIIGTVILARDYSGRGRSWFSKGALYAMLACLAWAIQYTLLDILVSRLGWFVPVALSQLVAVIGLFLFLFLRIHDGAQRRPRVAVHSIVATGVLSVLAFLAYGYGISLAYTAIVLPIASATPLLSTILARVYLRERLITAQKIGIALVLAGIIALAI